MIIDSTRKVPRKNLTKFIDFELFVFRERKELTHPTVLPAKREDDIVDVMLKSFDRSSSTSLIRYIMEYLLDSARTWNDSPGH